MKNKKYGYSIVIGALLILSMAIFRSLFYDRGGDHFLSHKSLTELPTYLSLWVDVMVIHVICACIATVFGALNFMRSLLPIIGRYHKLLGYIYVVAILFVDLTSGFLAVTSTGGKVTSIPFNMLNIYWLIATYLAIYYVRRQQLVKHKSWMIRSYLFCFLNMFIHLNTSWLNQFVGFDYRHSYTIAVYCSLLLCIVIAEFIVRRCIIPNKGTS